MREFDLFISFHSTMNINGGNGGGIDLKQTKKIFFEEMNVSFKSLTIYIVQYILYIQSQRLETTATGAAAYGYDDSVNIIMQYY